MTQTPLTLRRWQRAEYERLVSLGVFRGEPVKDKYVLICTKPHQEWALGQLTGERGKPVKMLTDTVFTSIEDAEREVFRRRWKKYTGSDLG